MNYEDWRITFQNSEGAARSAYNDAFKQWNRAQSLEAQLSECQRELAEYKRLFEEAQKQEPKAWMNPMNDVVIDAKRKVQIGAGDGYPNFSVPLYRAPIPAQQSEQPAQAGAVVPEGYALIPVALIDNFPEINVNNYSHDDACNLNAWGVELVLAADPKPEGETK